MGLKPVNDDEDQASRSSRARLGKIEEMRGCWERAKKVDRICAVCVACRLWCNPFKKVGKSVKVGEARIPLGRSRGF